MDSDGAEKVQGGSRKVHIFLPPPSALFVITHSREDDIIIIKNINTDTEQEIGPKLHRMWVHERIDNVVFNMYFFRKWRRKKLLLKRKKLLLLQIRRRRPPPTKKVNHEGREGQRKSRKYDFFFKMGYLLTTMK